MIEINKQQLKDILHVLGYSDTLSAPTKQIIADIGEKGFDSEHISVTGPDNEQIAIRITDDIWLYSEYDAFLSDNQHRRYKTEVLDYSDYTEKELEEELSPYVESLKEHKDTYGEDWKQIALECIFEQLDHYYDDYYSSIIN